MVKTPERIWEEADLPARRLAGLALNPSTPQDVLLRLLADGPAVVRMVLCRDRVLPDAVVDAVIEHPDTYTRSFFARNPHVDPAQRVRLIDDPEWFVRAHLADGPRMPFQVRPEPLPEEALVHMIRTYGNDELAGVFHQQISTELLRTMHTHPDAKVRRWGVGAWEWLSADARAALLADPDAGVRDRALLHTHNEDAVWLESALPAKPCHGRTGMLCNLPLTRAVVDLVLTAPASDDERAMIAHNPSLPADVVVLLAADPDPEVRESIAYRADLGPAERRALAVDPDPKVRLAVSVHPALSEEERAAIDYEVPMDCGFHHWPAPSVPRDPESVRRDALSTHPVLRRRAAGVYSLPPDLVARLADDEDLGVRVTLAQNHPDAPAALLLRSFLEYTGSDRAHLATRPNFPTARLAAFADHEDPEVRALAARDPETAPAVVEALTRDPDPAVRAAAARHPNLPRPRLTELLDDEELAHPAAANPALDVAEIRRLARTCVDPAGPSADTLT
ncbi:HEAT repeat domain-containing protein [Streptomyces sp. NPDC058086]|uniref:HEAT repeat domain-containing protein n=1 Tax=Streptomyces sp. NPDC058086 TaxID=3346334 RepID=UPI0036EBE04A